MWVLHAQFTKFQSHLNLATTLTDVKSESRQLIQTSHQACTQKVGMGVLIQSMVDPRCGGMGAQPPAAVAYLTKGNPENLL